jgi:hypothetical protein
MTENQYQAQLIRKLKRMFPDCVITKMDSSYQQGIPDLLILWHQNWALLEAKRSRTASLQPNQEYFIERLSGMSFASVIFPENEEDVLSALQQAFEPPRRARVSQPQ